MASPGMMQSGLSRELFEGWCSDRRNGLMMPGYSVAGALAHRSPEPEPEPEPDPNPNPNPNPNQARSRTTC